MRFKAKKPFKLKPQIAEQAARFVLINGIGLTISQASCLLTT